MARRKRKRVASRGSVNNIILKTLVNGDKYGYEIIKEVEEYSDGKIVLKQPSLYSSLSRFEDKKFVSSYWEDSDIGGRRHYYHLTDEGLAYYKKAVLKESDESVEDYMDELDKQSELIDFEEDSENLDEDNIIKDDSEQSEETLIEVSEEDIPALANFDQDQEDSKNTQQFIPDHPYYKPTPMDSLILVANNKVDHEINAVDHSEPETSPTQEESQISSMPWTQLADLAKKSNHSFASVYKNTFYLRKPKKVQKVILDRDGIYKLRDEDYQEEIKTSKPVIIDNVIKRTKDSSIYGYGAYVDSNTKPKSNNEKAYSELSEEEKKQRNENFLAKFNLLTKSKMKPVSAPIVHKESEYKQEKPIDYRGKLNAIIESSSYEDNFIEDNNESEIKNNLYNYEYDEDWNTTSDLSDPPTTSDNLDDDDKFIDFEPDEFETKSNNTAYIQQISNYSASDVKINKYEHSSQAVLVDKSYILINKLKFVFGIIMTLLMTAELTIALFIFKNNGLFVSGDKTVFILGYSIIGLIALIYILPFCFNSNEHKANNFKFKYSFGFGILTFLVVTILIYCINALTGFELDNIKYFAVKLFVPMILSFNFIIAPIIYQFLNKSKKFYD